MKERENMTMKVPGAKRPIKTTLLADATRVHADWYQPISPPAAPTPPNWERWLYVPSIELGNAIALTLDIDPACLSSGKHLIPEYFKTRLVVAIEHLRPGGVLSDFSGEAREGSIVVTLQAVAQLANFCRWSLPPEFPKPEPVPARADVEPVATQTEEVKRGGRPRTDAPEHLELILVALESYAAETGQHFDRRAMPGPMGDGHSHEGSFHWLCAKVYPSHFLKSKSIFEGYRNGVCTSVGRTKATDFYRDALPHIALILGVKRNVRKLPNRATKAA